MTVKELREVLATLNDDVYVLCAGADPKVAMLAGDQLTIDDDATHHVNEDGEPLHSYHEVLWSAKPEPHEMGPWEQTMYDAALKGEGWDEIAYFIKKRLGEAGCDSDKSINQYTQMIDALLLFGRIADQVSGNVMSPAKY